MKVLMPFPNMSDFYWYRYRNQLTALARRVDKLYILYWNGYRQDEEDNIIFIKVSKKRLPFYLGKTKFPIKNYFEAKRLVRHLPKIKFDLLYCMSGSARYQYMYQIIARELKIPIVLRLRGDGKSERDLHIKNRFKRRLHDYYDNEFMKKVDLIVPIKEEFIDEFIERGVDKSLFGDTVPIGVDIEEFKLSDYPKGNLIIGYFGRISKEKGIRFLVDVMKKTPNIQYIVAGMKMIDIDFPDNCQYLGVLKHSSMSGCYDLCHITAIPSDFEGLSNSLLETYAKGRPVIITPESHPENVPVFGWELKRDIDRWVYLINSINKEKEYTIEWRGLKAREWVTGYTWEKFGNRMLEQFKKVVVGKTDWSSKTESLQTIWTVTPDIPEYRRSMINLISEYLWRHREWSLLDCGHGTGLIHEYLPENLKDRYYGIDLTMEMVDFCREKYEVDKFRQGDVLYPNEIPESNLIVTQNVIQHITLWQLALKNIIEKAKDVVIFCERTHDFGTMKVGNKPTRWRFNVDDFVECMAHCGKGLWKKPKVYSHPTSTEGLENCLTIFIMEKLYL